MDVHDLFPTVYNATVKELGLIMSVINERNAIFVLKYLMGLLHAVRIAR